MNDLNAKLKGLYEALSTQLVELDEAIAEETAAPIKDKITRLRNEVSRLAKHTRRIFGELLVMDEIQGA